MMMSASLPSLSESSSQMVNEESEADSPFSVAALERLKERFQALEDLKLFDQNDFNVDARHVVLMDQIAKGSYGIVYKGSYNGAKYAVKIENLKSGVEEQVNVLSELTLLQSLQHENLVSYCGSATLLKSASEAKIMILTELCENGALRERIFDTELSWKLITRLSLDVVRGLDYMHQHHLIHRDIKTTNILINADWRAKICDFSFGVHESVGTNDGFVYGTEEFMAPEVAMGENFDVSADIFSFGVVLCEMICKREPSQEFLHRDAKCFFELNVEQLKSAILSGCPQSMEALAIQCCDSDRFRRPPASGCVEWLEAMLEDLDPEDTLRNLPDISKDIAIPAGVMSSLREGCVKYPNATQDFVTGELPTYDRLHENNIDQILQGILGRVSYLELQVQELRTENSCLAKELTAIQRDYIRRFYGYGDQWPAGSPNKDSTSDPLQNSYVNRILHPNAAVLHDQQTRSYDRTHDSALDTCSSGDKFDQDISLKVESMERDVSEVSLAVGSLKQNMRKNCEQARGESEDSKNRCNEGKSTTEDTMNWSEKSPNSSEEMKIYELEDVSDCNNQLQVSLNEDLLSGMPGQQSSHYYSMDCTEGGNMRPKERVDYKVNKITRTRSGRTDSRTTSEREGFGCDKRPESFLSQSFSPKRKEVMMSRSRSMPCGESMPSFPSSSSSSTPQGETTWREVSSQSPFKRSGLGSEHRAAKSQINLSMEWDEAQEAKAVQREPSDDISSGYSSAGRNSDNTIKSNKMSGQWNRKPEKSLARKTSTSKLKRSSASFTSKGRVKGEGFFKDDHLYNYVFGKESSGRSKQVSQMHTPTGGKTPRNQSQAVKHNHLSTSQGVSAIGLGGDMTRRTNQSSHQHDHTKGYSTSLTSYMHKGSRSIICSK